MRHPDRPGSLNKARKARGLFDVVQSLDSVDLARRLARAAAESGTTLRAFLQVDLAGEESKFGVPAAEAKEALEEIRGLEGLRVEGLMTLPPYVEAEEARPYFRRLRVLRDEAREAGLLEGDGLSMGMSHDFEVAVEEGATLLRVGSALFASRV